MKKQIALLAAAGLVLSTAPAMAYEKGDIIIRGGIVTVMPNDDSDAIELPDLTLNGGVEVDDATSVSLMGVWMMSDNWGLELLAAAPFEHDIDVADLGIDAGSTKHLPPTLSLQWYPRGGLQGWQPYLGLGINYTTFFSEDVSGELGGALNDLYGFTNPKLSLDDSVGLAAQAGVDFPINDKWAVNLGVWYIDLSTTADIKVNTADGGSAKVSFDVDIDPWVYNVGVSYKF